MKAAVNFLNIIQHHPPSFPAIIYNNNKYTYSDLVDRSIFWKNILSDFINVGEIIVCDYIVDPFEYTSQLIGIMAAGGIHFSTRQPALIHQRLDDLNLNYVIISNRLPSVLSKLKYCHSAYDNDGVKYYSSEKSNIESNQLKIAGRILETSGSTGLPKLVYWTESALIADRMSWVSTLSLSQNDVILNLHPLDFAHGIDVHILSGLMSKSVIIHKNIGTDHIDDICVCIKHFGVTMLSALPSHYCSLANAAKDNNLGTSVRWALTGGALLSKASVEDIYSKSGLKLKRLYGATELGIMCADLSDTHQVEPALEPLTGVSIKLEKLSNGVSDHFPHIGEAYFKRDNMASIYIGDENKTNETFNNHGWYKSGDAVMQNPNGTYSVLGRAEDVWMDADKTKLYCSGELTNSLLELNCVTEVAIIPSIYSLSGKVIVFCTISKQELIQHIETAINLYLQSISLDAILFLSNEWPRTIVGKPDRRALLSWAASS